MGTITVIATVFIIAAVVEALLEYIFGIWWRPFNEAIRPKILMAFGLVFGIALCVWYKVDLMSELGLPASVVGQIITGAIAGRGSEFAHGLINKLKG